MNSQLLDSLKKLLGADGVLHKPEDLLLYEYDGSIESARPDCVVFPRTAEDVAAIVYLAHRYETPLVGRGAGTGLSGGALARQGGIVTVFSRMNHILSNGRRKPASHRPARRGELGFERRRCAPQIYTSRPILPARRRAPSAEMFLKIPAARTRWPMA